MFVVKHTYFYLLCLKVDFKLTYLWWLLNVFILLCILVPNVHTHARTHARAHTHGSGKVQLRYTLTEKVQQGHVHVCGCTTCTFMPLKQTPSCCITWNLECINITHSGLNHLIHTWWESLSCTLMMLPCCLLHPFLSFPQTCRPLPIIAWMTLFSYKSDQGCSTQSDRSSHCWTLFRKIDLPKLCKTLFWLENSPLNKCSAL